MSEVLTKIELILINRRIGEINETLDLCDENFDSDIIFNLEAELDAIVQRLEESERLARRRERGLKAAK